MNARSRLSQKTEQSTNQEKNESHLPGRSEKKRFKSSPNNNYPYIRHIPLLILSGLCFFWLIKVATTTYPNQIANFLIPQSYLPILVPFFLTFLFFLGYLTLNIKRGFILSFFATLLVFFRLQQISFEIWWLGIFVLVTLIATAFTKK